MDLLAGYGSDSSESDAPPPKKSQSATRKHHLGPTAKSKPEGKRLLSLQAVLPKEIFDRLSRPEEQNSDSEDEEERDRKRPKVAVNRSGVNSLLDELKSVPRQSNGAVIKRPESNNDAVTKKPDEEGEGLGMAFMSYTTQRSKVNENGVMDVHAPKLKEEPPKKVVKRPFMRSTAAPIPRSFQQTQTSADVPETHVMQPTTEYTAETRPETNNMQINMNSRKQRRQQERSLRSGAAFHNTSNTASTMEIHQPSPAEYAPTAHMAAIASRAAHLRTIGGVDDNDTSNYGEYGQQKVKSAGVAMYDPKTGSDVKGGVTGKHKSKHQINQLMVNAMGLEASRAGEAELARLGFSAGGGNKASGGRADAKNKYGW